MEKCLAMLRWKNWIWYFSFHFVCEDVPASRLLQGLYSALGFSSGQIDRTLV